MRLNDILTESPTDKGAFKALFVIGPPGSGKSSVSSSLTIPPTTQVVNYDKHQNQIASRRGLSELDPSHQDMMNREVKLNIEDDVIRALNNTSPIIADTVGADENQLLRRIVSFQKLGYDVAVIAIDVSEQTSLDRAKNREETEERSVDIPYIKRVHQGKGFIFSNVQRHLGDSFKVISNEGSSIDTVKEQANSFAVDFFNSPIQNEKGQKLKSKMQTQGLDTITPELMSVHDFNRYMSLSWYQHQKQSRK